MADVEMADAVSAADSKAKTPVKSSKAGASEAAGDSKKRFEVKKVQRDASVC